MPLRTVLIPVRGVRNDVGLDNEITCYERITKSRRQKVRIADRIKALALPGSLLVEDAS